MNELTGTVYLLHFSERISDRHTTQHYIGWAESVEARLSDHRAGRGARLTEVANERGITYECVRIWSNKDRHFERKLKERKDGPRLCPLCCEDKGTRPKGGRVEVI